MFWCKHTYDHLFLFFIFIYSVGLCFSTRASPFLAQGINCPAIHGILVPQPGSDLHPPALEGRFLNTGRPGKS